MSSFLAASQLDLSASKWRGGTSELLSFCVTVAKCVCTFNSFLCNMKMLRVSPECFFGGRRGSGKTN